jgi:hypothetical protein
MTRYDEPWERCPSGELRRLSDALKSQRRRRHLAAIAGAAAVVVALFTLAAVILPWPAATLPAAMACDDVVAFLPSYVAGTLDAPLAERVEHHLSTCPHCREAHKRLLEGGVSTANMAGAIVSTTGSARHAY